MVEKEKGCNATNCDKHCSLCMGYSEGLVLDGCLGHNNSRLIFRYLLHNYQHILNIFLLESLVKAIFDLYNLYRGLYYYKFVNKTPTFRNSVILTTIYYLFSYLNTI